MKTMYKVLIPTKLNNKAKDILEDAGYEVIQDAQTPLNDLISTYSDVSALIVRSEKITEEVIDALPNLKVVIRAGAGYNTIDCKHAKKKKIAVMNTPGANSNAVAEEVVAMFLAASRHILPADKSTREGLWEKSKFMGTELLGKTVGILGFGNIGQQLVKRLAGFDNKFLVFDPYVSAEKAKDFGVELTDCDKIFAESDFITLHIPATPETEKMISTNYLEKMKEGAVLVNCARAEVLDEDALREIKKNKNIIFCNDVYAADTAGEKTIADVADIMLPHLGASSIEANTNAAIRAAEQLIAYDQKGVTKFVVNKALPDGLSEEYQNLAHCLSKLASGFLGDKSAPFEIQTSFYGQLEEFGEWFLSPIVAGMSPEFDPMLEISEAKKYLEEKGIRYVNREIDKTKKFKDSMTVDLLQGEDNIRRVSIRGTITEGNLMISRINDFENLYFLPNGNHVIFVYEDRPGVLAAITKAVAAEGINVCDIRSPQSENGNKAIAVLQVNSKVSKETIERISDEMKCETAFQVQV